MADTTTLFDKIQEASNHIRKHYKGTIDGGIILGTGLKDEDFESVVRLSYHDIPHLGSSTVESHKGELFVAKIGLKHYFVFSGRFHLYEGKTGEEIGFPVRLIKAFGGSQIFITNAAGGLNPSYIPGDIVIIKDHINLQSDNPLKGTNDERLGIRFPDMLEAYDKELIKKAEAILHQKEQVYYKGIYLGLMGPSLETPNEYRFLNQIKADVVGMSTVPEVIVARHSQLKTMVISVVSNACYPIHLLKETTIDEVVKVMNETTPRVIQLIKEIISTD